MANREKAQIVLRTGLLEYEESDRAMSEVGGLANLKDWLAKRGRLSTDAARKSGIKPPKGALLCGVPGTGKNALRPRHCFGLESAAGALGCRKTVWFAGRRIGSEPARCTSHRGSRIALRPVARDEIEKGFGNSGGLDGGTSQRVFGALLTWMQDKKSEVFVVGTANDINKLDAALIRRFDAVFAVDLPDYTSRAEILGIHLKRAGTRWRRTLWQNWRKSARVSTGSELEAAVQSALIEAFNDGVETDRAGRGEGAARDRAVVEDDGGFDRRAAGIL